MIQEFIKDCILFKSKVYRDILIGLASWSLIAVNVLCWVGIIKL